MKGYPKFKIGDRVICIALDKNTYGGIMRVVEENYGGAGWKEGLIGEIQRISFAENESDYLIGEPIYWFKEFQNGVFERFLKKYKWSFKEAVRRIKNEK